MDRTKAADFAFEAITSIGERFEGQEVRTGEMMLLVEVERTDEDGEEAVHIMSYSSDARAFFQLGMLQSAILSIEDDTENA